VSIGVPLWRPHVEVRIDLTKLLQLLTIRYCVSCDLNCLESIGKGTFFFRLANEIVLPPIAVTRASIANATRTALPPIEPVAGATMTV
jgi:hypothetical protein